MKQLCKKITSCSYWFLLAVIIYLIAMLIYVTINFFENSDPVKIADFGSVLSGVATLFTGLIALYIFSNWKNQTNKLTLKDEAKLLFSKINYENYQSEKIEEMLQKYSNLKYTETFQGKKPNSLERITKYKINIANLINDLDDFSDLASDTNLKQLIKNHKENLNTYKLFFSTIEGASNYPYGNNFLQQEKTKRGHLNESLKAIKNCIKAYILLKK